jgi:hypothetical protein
MSSEIESPDTIKLFNSPYKRRKLYQFLTKAKVTGRAHKKMNW